jgi:hypothetical protein
MADKPMDTYLNDHLAGSTLGIDLAKQIRDRSEGRLRALMERITAEIEEDRETLIELMERMGATKNPVKQAGAWMTEKASRVKFSGLSSGEPDVGLFMALESLTLGVAGKECMWQVLLRVQDGYEPLAAIDLDRLIERARTQHAQLEQERIRAGTDALVGEPAAAR